MKIKAGVKRITLTVITLLFVAFILSNSMKTAEVSSKQSGDIMALLQEIIDFLGLPITLTSFFLRKFAHFAEFCVLAILSGFTLRTYTKRIMRYVFVPLFLGLAVAVADEFIQLYSSGRAGAVRDVVLDFSGFVFGLAAAYLIIILRNKKRSARKKNKCATNY